MAAMDDATGKTLAAVFCPFECSWGYLELLRRVVRDHGVPCSVYQDEHTALKRNDEFWSLEEELAGKQEATQVGAALVWRRWASRQSLPTLRRPRGAWRSYSRRCRTGLLPRWV